MRERDASLGSKVEKKLKKMETCRRMGFLEESRVWSLGVTGVGKRIGNKNLGVMKRETSSEMPAWRKECMRNLGGDRGGARSSFWR